MKEYIVETSDSILKTKDLSTAMERVQENLLHNIPQTFKKVEWLLDTNK